MENNNKKHVSNDRHVSLLTVDTSKRLVSNVSKDTWFVWLTWLLSCFGAVDVSKIGPRGRHASMLTSACPIYEGHVGASCARVTRPVLKVDPS